MEMTVLTNKIKYSIKDCENGRHRQNAENIWRWMDPTKFNIVTLMKQKKKTNQNNPKKMYNT